MTQKLIFRLITGEDIIGKATKDEGTDTISVEDPFTIMSRWDNDGTLKMGVLPFMPYAKGNVICLKRDNIVATADPAEDVEKMYSRHTSGIVLP